MPYSITQDAAECDGYAVVKDSDGTVMGCHDTQDEAAQQIAAIEASEDDRADGVDTTPPEYMQDAARRGLEMHKEGKSGDGLEGATVREAQRMADGEALTEAKVRKGNAFWGRNSNYCNEDASDAQVTSRLLWGGCQSIDWFDRKAQALEDADRMTRADADDLSIGDRVEWDSSGGMAYGEIEAKETDGSISAEPDGPTMEGAEDDPAFGVRVYQPGEDGWEASDVLTVHRAGALTKIESFPDERVASDTDTRKAPHTPRVLQHLSGTTQRMIDSGYGRSVVSSTIRQSSDGSETSFKFFANELARDGVILRSEGLSTENYMRNPLVFWQHGQDPRRGYDPIGTTRNMMTTADGGRIAQVLREPDEFAQYLFEKVDRGSLRATSIGWHHNPSAVKFVEQDGRKVPVIEESDMTEFSVVGVPSDPDALKVGRAHDDLDSIAQRAATAAIEKYDKQLRDAATAATPRTEPAPEATAPDADDVQRDDAPDADLDRLVGTIDRIINKKLGRA